MLRFKLKSGEKAKIWWSYDIKWEKKETFKSKKGVHSVTITEKEIMITKIHFENSSGTLITFSVYCSPEDTFYKSKGRIISLKKLLSSGVFPVEDIVTIIEEYKKTIKDKYSFLKEYLKFLITPYGSVKIDHYD